MIGTPEHTDETVGPWSGLCTHWDRYDDNIPRNTTAQLIALTHADLFQPYKAIYLQTLKKTLFMYVCMYVCVFLEPLRSKYQTQLPHQKLKSDGKIGEAWGLT